MNDYEKLFYERAEESLKPKTHKKKKSSCTRIKFDGEFITTHSNKTVWRTPAHAKSALKNHLAGIENQVFHEIGFQRMRQHGWERYGKDAVGHQFVDKMLENGRLEFVPVDEKTYIETSQGK